MKKTFGKIIITVLAFCLMLSAIACGGAKWDASKVTLKTPGDLISHGGFVAETANYVYFINGNGDSTQDNTLGAPVKGALYAAEKANLDNVSIVVPKLFVASDYKAGLFISGGYVYYGSPSTEKNSSGNIANDELVFARTKLDGTGTETFFTVSSLSVEYRIVEIESVIYIVYYDGVDSLISYNTSTKASEVIAKKDVKAKTESLNAYHFMSNEASNDITVIYTVTVYSEEYYESAAEALGSNYSRASEAYNKVYAYKPGDTKAEGSECAGVKVLDGEGVGKGAKTYAITLISGENVFYTETDGNSNVKTYGITAKNLHAKATSIEIKNASYVAETSLIQSLATDGGVYATENSMIVKTTLTGNTQLVKKTVADGATVSKLLFVDGDYIYYYNSENKLARICISEDISARTDVQLKEQLVSEDTVSTSWYAPEIVAGKIFYLDDSALGASYVKYVVVDSTAIIETEKDDDGKITSAKLSGHKELSVKTEADKAGIVTAKIEALSTEFATTIAFDVDADEKVVITDGQPNVSSVVKARAAYNALSNEAKALVTDETLAVLTKYETAVKLAQLMYKLEGFEALETDDAKNALKDAYNAVKAKIGEIKASDMDYATIRDMIPNDYKYSYQQAGKFFEAE